MMLASRISQPAIGRGDKRMAVRKDYIYGAVKGTLVLFVRRLGGQQESS
jgi:hypothetical protein